MVVDLHCHLLPGIDDGARDLADALAMARQAQEDGIAAICATPHIRHDHDVRIMELPRRRRTLAEAIHESGCVTQVLPGGEVAASALPELDDLQLRELTLGGGGRWILLEPPAGPLDSRLDEAVASLAGRGFRAIIAHPERHPSEDLIRRLRVLTQRHGALVQGTGDFLLHDATRGAMVALAEAGVLHVLASDAHSSLAGRPVALAAAVRQLAAVPRCAPHLEWIRHEAPSAIVAGEAVEPPF